MAETVMTDSLAFGDSASFLIGILMSLIVFNRMDYQLMRFFLSAIAEYVNKYFSISLLFLPCYYQQ